MKNKSVISRVITGTVLAVTVMSTSTIAFAANARNTFKGMPVMHARMDNSRLKTQLDALVTDGTITQAQEDAIEKLFTASNNGNGGLKTQLDALVTLGTITQDQEDAVEKQFAPPNNSRDGRSEAGKNNNNSKNTENGLTSELDALVTAGTITQAQEDAVVKLFVHPSSGKQNLTTPSATTVQTSEEPLDNDGLTTQLDALVTVGTITQAQEDAILDLFTNTTDTTETSQAQE